ncbi:LlaJI family restriction endonuclease [Enterococcus faecium]
MEDLLSIFGIPTILISDEQPNDFGDNHYLEYLIEQELSRQFVTSKQIVLKNLLRYIRETEENEINENIQMYGTTSFNLVWEDICKKIYRNHLEVKLSSLRLKLIGK